LKNILINSFVMKAIFRMFATGLLITGLCPVVLAQNEETSDLKQKLSSKSFVFKARTASPARGRTIHLTSDYTLKVSGDSVIADLPYYGRAYSAPIGQPGGISFTSVEYNYSLTQDKKNRWRITIDPKDLSDAQEMSMTVYENGQADLIVTSNSRQAITFRGHITGR
jgi:hypothetical protein